MSNWAESITARIGLDASGFVAGAKRVESATEKMSEHFFGLNELSKRVAGAFTAGAIIEGLRRASEIVMEHITKIKDLSEQYGISTTEVQAFGLAARKVGLETEDMTKALDKVLAAREKAMEGDEGALNLFGSFGISGEELKNTESALDLFKRISNEVRGRDVADPNLRRSMQELFGKSGARMLSAMNELEGVDISQIIPEETVKRMDDLAKHSERASNALKSMGAKTGAASILPAFWSGIKAAGATGLALLGGWKSPAGMLGPEIDKAQRDALLEEYNANRPQQYGPTITDKSRRELSDKADQQQRESATSLRDQQLAATHIYGQYSTREERKKLIADEINALMNEATGMEREGDTIGGRKVRTRALGLVPSLAETMRDARVNMAPDSLAAVGGFVGYGGAYNPALQMQQDLLATVKDISGKITSPQTRNLTP